VPARARQPQNVPVSYPRRIQISPSWVDNGVDVPLADLVARVRGLQRAFADLRIELIDQIEAPGRVVIVFWQLGRHVGPLETP
jgi:hypothetical protein